MYRWAALRLVIITLVTITTLMGAAYGLRWIATLGDPSPPLLPQVWAGVTPWIMNPVSRAEDLSASCPLPSSQILILEIRPSRDGVWFLANNKLEIPTETLTSGEVKDRGVLPAAQALEQCRREPLGIRVHSQESQGATSVQELIRAAGIQSPLILSTHQCFLRALRKLEPHWIYASDPSSYLRWKIMSALGLESIATMDYDVFFIPLLQSRTPTPPLNLLNEARRRNIPVIFEWDGKTEISQEVLQWARGVYSQYPDLARKLLSH